MRRRSGFTLVEMLIVITIILILAGLVFAVFNTGRSSDRLRSAARIGQSAFLGAKDRALHAKDLRGVRLTRDLTDTTLVTGFVYLQPIPIQTAGNYPTPNVNNVTVTRPNIASGNFDATQVLISGTQGQTWFTQDQNGIWPPSPVQIRIPAQTGQWLNLARVQNTPPYWGTMNAGNLQLTLQTAYQGGNPPPAPNAIDPNMTTASCDIQLGNDVLPFHQAIPLSSNVVIDLKFCSANIQTLAGLQTGVNYYVDIMFSPRGGVSGYLSGLGPMHFLLRDLKDAVATSQIKDANGNFCGGRLVGACPTAVPAQTEDPNKGDRLVLSVFPQTGLVQVFEIDPTDIVNNLTGVAGPDGLADNIFFFAQQGKSAGR
jgi:prepilin-type N-terminal cleavage/methylation domain-containing protein